MDIDQYWGLIKIIAPQIKDELILYSFRINIDQFVDILSTFKLK